MSDDSDVAEAVARPVPDAHKGAIMCRGYLVIDQSGTAPANADPARLYIENSFRVWLRFTRADMLHHIPGGADPCCPMGIVWIKREAAIRKVEAGFAYDIAEPLMMMMQDPASAAGPNPPWHGPNPPWHGPNPPWH